MGQKVYYYIFDHDIPGDDAGSFHGSDLWFMFDSLGNSWRPFEGKHYDLARQVTSYWTNFVKYGDPNALFCITGWNMVKVSSLIRRRNALCLEK